MDYGTTPQESGFSSIWEALRNWNTKRQGVNAEFDAAGGRNIDVLKNRANVGTPPFVPPGQQAQPWHPPMALPGQSDPVAAQVGPQSPTPPAPPAPPNVTAAGPGLPPSPVQAGGGKEPSGVPAPADPSSEYASLHDELGPEALAQIMGMGGLEEQLQTAQGLRDKEAPSGRYVSNGRIYTAGSALEHAVTGYGRYKGKKDVKRIQGEQAAGRTKVWDLLRKKGINPETYDPNVEGGYY